MNLLKNMKPIVAVILVLSFVFSASACGKTDTKEKPGIIAQLKDKIFNKDEPTTTTTAPYTEYYNEPATEAQTDVIEVFPGESEIQTEAAVTDENTITVQVSGCRSSVGGSIGVIAIAAIAGVAFAFKKKED